MKVEELLDIVASQECVFNNAHLGSVSPIETFEGVLLTVGLDEIGIYRPAPNFGGLSLSSLADTLRKLDPKGTVSYQSSGGTEFKIGFLDYDDGWVETVTSEELGLSEVVG
mgnify:CR=1 FL=1|tara:strand:- start:12416 stop:12748 length:333 start_codon:yes stop_codon:yes gene_type:complete